MLHFIYRRLLMSSAVSTRNILLYNQFDILIVYHDQHGIPFHVYDL